MNQVLLVIIVILIALLAMASIWAFVSAIAYYLEWRRIGIPWNSFVTLARSGTGCIIVDHSIGRARGLGSIVVWWSPVKIVNAKLIPIYLNTSCKFTACPKRLRTANALAMEFPNVQIVENFTLLLRL